jgi:hypothetical protein
MTSSPPTSPTPNTVTSGGRIAAHGWRDTVSSSSHPRTNIVGSTVEPARKKTGKKTQRRMNDGGGEFKDDILEIL